jgi:hypothetical protein
MGEICSESTYSHEAQIQWRPRRGSYLARMQLHLFVYLLGKYCQQKT